MHWTLLLLTLPALAEVSFNRDIRPIMADTCFRCHGPDKSSRMADLRLDIREEALKPNKAGVAPIVPGEPAKSAIVQRVFASDARIMPPKFAHKDLTGTQKQTIRQWVAEGAKYEEHWSYLPVPPRNPAARNSVDTFIQARLAREKLRPSPEAGLRTLARRASLDLTGLPPSTEQLNAFLNDKTPNAYEKYVEKLLASPAYAEKQTLHWLDAVRYADTAGFHGDNPFPIWPYRDYVLRSFRDNKPFDQFTREQLAGDLLPNATEEQKVASAFNRLSRMSAEGGLQPKEYLAKYAADRVRTVSATWLGSTLGCAECHDHKFDPFASKDFYSMKAFFADILETGLVPDRGAKAWGAQMDLPTADQQRRREQLSWQLSEARREFDAEAQILHGADEQWEKETLKRNEAGEFKWQLQRPLSAESVNGARLRIYNDQPIETNYYVGATLMTDRTPGNGLVVAEGPNPDNETYIVRIQPGAGVWTALGVEVVQDESLPSHRLARGSDRLVVTEVEAELDGRKTAFVMATASLTFPSADLHPSMAIDGNPKTGWGVSDPGNNNSLFLALRFSEPLKTEAGATLTIRLRHDSDDRRATIGRFRLALSSARYSWPDQKLTGLSPAVLAALKVSEEKRTEPQRRALAEYYAFSNSHLQSQAVRIARLEAELGLLEATIPRVVITKSTVPAETRVLPRGNWMDGSGAIVDPAIPGFLGKLSTDRQATRLDLAEWLTSRDNPLTARVFVNRLWRQFFGAGLSKVLDDLGSQGEMPTHPELLDWLAAEFMRNWDVKHVIRTIVTSHTYRQSSDPVPSLVERDPDNRLLARQSRLRVEAETVRDIALAVSGLLKPRFGGPSVRPYQPEGYLGALNFPKREYSASRGDDLYRRGLYTFWQRTFLLPSMQVFDAPSREECTVNRSSSDTPLQALTLLNDPIFVEAARGLAQNMIQSGGATLAQRIGWAFHRAVSRAPSVEERKALTDLYSTNLARYKADEAAARELISAGEAPPLSSASPAELAATTTVARAILNMHETITRN
ncbi:MAG: DUF1553 domain-containing protein [Acidimicrobiia bacterium]|nr:DUF1553 domain-containing protein [Acidimicrobiia bacterium]